MNGKVLIVDDDPSVLLLLGRYLTDSGYEVLSAGNGAEALRIFAAEGPSIILADWTMPKMDGLELCRAIRSGHGPGFVYIIMLTVHEEKENLLEAFEAGVDDYLIKPPDREELLARIRAGQRVLRLLHQQCGQTEALKAAKTKAEEALRQLEQAHSQLLQADKMASIGQLAAGVAHEINNPIGFISSNLNSLGHYVEDLKRILAAYGELLSLCIQSPSAAVEKAGEVEVLRKQVGIDYVISDIGDLITESIDGTNRVRQIVADLRDFSHVDNSDVHEEDINQLMEKTINVAWNELKYKTEVIREYGELPLIPCYGGKLGQVFLNLLVNAAQAIDVRGVIKIRTIRLDEHACIEVSDTGCGIPTENLNRIFDPFFTTKGVGKGTGMGLHLAYKIISAHGGRISVQSAVGKGTTFRIELPLAGPPEAREKKDESVA